MMQGIKDYIYGIGDGSCGVWTELALWLGVMVVVVFIATIAMLNLFENYWLIKRKDY